MKKVAYPMDAKILEERFISQILPPYMRRFLRLELVIVGVLPDGRKEVIAVEDGYRESTESWTSVLRDLKLALAKPVWRWPSSCCWPLNSVGDASMRPIWCPG